MACDIQGIAPLKQGARVGHHGAKTRDAEK